MSAHCPNCRSDVDPSAARCNHCNADFSGAAAWKPVSGAVSVSEKATGNAARTLSRLGVATVVIPVLAFLIGLLLTALIPGCHCDEGSGCMGCGADEFLSVLVFGGFSGALGALFTALPICLLLAADLKRWAGRQTS